VALFSSSSQLLFIDERGGNKVPRSRLSYNSCEPNDVSCAFVLGALEYDSGSSKTPHHAMDVRIGAAKS
jgi:hypothetical protein